MKTLGWVFALIGLTLGACSTQKQATTLASDEVYSLPASAGNNQVALTPVTEKGTQVITAPDNATGSKPGSSTFADDYNDYSYSSRIERFNNADTTKKYFDESYTSSAQADNSASDPSINVYLGYGAGYGGYSSAYFGFGWGYPYSPWGWDYGWYNPYPGWGWGYPYYGYGYGYYPYYNPCCYCYGYYNGYNEGYPYYADTYYGPRQSLTRSDIGTNALNSRSYNSLNNNTLAPGSRSETTAVNTRAEQTSTRSVQNTAPRSSTASQEKYRYTRSANSRQAPQQRTTTQGQRQTNVERSQPSPKYVKPENAAAAKRSGSAQSYSSPVYRQPKTSQEYLSPRSQAAEKSRVTETINRSFGGTAPSTESRQTVPSNGNSRSGVSTERTRTSGYTQPTRSNTSVTTPARSGSGTYSTPQRSQGSGTYSAPSRSSGSGNSAPSGGSNYSAPSRSSGSGGSAPSGSGSGGGRRK